MNTKELLVRAVREGANVTMFLEALTEVRPATPQEKAVIAAAREQRHKEGEIEIDEVTVASIDEYDPGARGGYVLAWVWAELEEGQGE